MTPRYRAASTTDAGIAVSNLNSEIAQLESALVGDRGLSAERLAELGERLTLRGAIPWSGRRLRKGFGVRGARSEARTQERRRLDGSRQGQGYIP